MKIIIDVGHLNNTYEKTKGKGCYNKVLKRSVEEFNLNSLIAEALFSILTENHHEVYFSIPNWKTKNEPDLRRDRTNKINSFNPDLSISLHLDYSSDPKTKGFTIYTWRGNKKTSHLKNKMTDNFKSIGMTECSLNNNGYSISYSGHQGFDLLSNVECDAMLIENGFFSNPEDVIFTENNYYKMASAIANAIDNKIKINTKPKRMSLNDICWECLDNGNEWRDKFTSLGGEVELAIQKIYYRNKNLK